MVEREILGFLNANGITQKHISDVTGISAPALNMMLKGKRRIQLEEYALICGALQLNTDYFLKPRAPNKTKN